MKRSRFTQAQIVAILKEGEAGRPVAELLRQQWHQLGDALDAWKARYGGLSASVSGRRRRDGQ